MDEYRPLSKLFYADSSPRRFTATAEEAQARLLSLSTFRTGIILKSNERELGELFLAVPRKLSFLNEEVLRVERKVSRLWNALPGLARWAHLRSLVMDEIVSTNEIEGIHSSRKQVARALDIVHERRHDPRKEQFVEMARLYLELSDKEHVYPHTLEDIRQIYDRIVADDVEKTDLPDGRLFRSEAVEVCSAHGNVIHSGAFPESEIERLLREMLGLMDENRMPAIYAALISHFLFEYIHPFYDGNGRTGRYLLALYLSEPLSITTVLSLSRVIAENKSAYYKAFDTVENPLNHAEGTFFVLAMMKLIRTAQDETIEQLEEKSGKLRYAQERLAWAQGQLDLSDKAAELLYLVVQYAMFDEFGEVTLADASQYMQASPQTARKYFAELENKELVTAVSRRPLRYVPTDKAKRGFGLAPSGSDEALG